MVYQAAANSGDPYETGNDGKFKIGGQQFAVTNVSYDREAETADVQLDDSLWPRNAITGLRASGSFEHDGANEDLRQAVEEDSGSGCKEAGQPKFLGTLVVKESGDSRTDPTECPGLKTTRFEGVLVESRSKDSPSDDVTSMSYDFIAEKMLPNG
jgi:hypothetical protein